MFKNILKGKVVIVGIGNILKGDDAFGPALIERLKDNPSFICIDAGTAPENYVGKIVEENPNTVIIADAAYLGRKTGEYELIKKKDIIKTGLTTHDLSPAMFIEYLEKSMDADIYMLAAQPENVNFGEEMSRTMKETVEKLARLIEETKHA